MPTLGFSSISLALIPPIGFVSLATTVFFSASKAVTPPIGLASLATTVFFSASKAVIPPTGLSSSLAITPVSAVVSPAAELTSLDLSFLLNFLPQPLNLSLRLLVRCASTGVGVTLAAFFF